VAAAVVDVFVVDCVHVVHVAAGERFFWCTREICGRKKQRTR